MARTRIKKKSKVCGPYDGCTNQFVFNEVPNRTECLDVGCWTGNLGRVLIKTKKCIIDGLDFKTEVLKEARANGYRKTFLVNLNNEEISLKYIGDVRYDVIIFADCLEHTIDPLGLLKKFKRFLKPNGQMIISVPNVLFASQRLHFLLGKFDYSEGGIMDKTHLRFFSRKSFWTMCRKSGLGVERIYGYSQVKDKFFFLRPLAALFPNIFAVQFLAVLRKPGNVK